MRKWPAIGGIIFLFLLGACAEDTQKESAGPEEETETAEKNDAAEVSKEETEPEKKESEPEEESETTPLTGESVETVSQNRSMAVMVNNHPEARPQSGLTDADLVYEVLTEGDMTRMLAIYQNQEPDEIGPVRSARGYFIDLANGYDSLYVAHGWSPEAEQMLQGGAAPFLNGLHYDGTLFKRATDRQAPHNSYISYEDAEEGLSEKGYEMEKDTEPLFFRKDETEPYSPEWTTAGGVDIHYQNSYVVNYDYNETDEKYERSSDGETTVDKNNKEQVKPANIFIVEAAHQVVDEQGRRQISLETGGDALLLQEGKALHTEWINEDGRLLPEKDGELIPFVPGQTWIHIIPSDWGISGAVEGLKE